MSNKLKNIYTNAFDNIIKKHIRAKANTIFVLAGITPYIYVENFKDSITDQATFDKKETLICLPRHGLEVCSRSSWLQQLTKFCRTSSMQVSTNT